METEAAKDAKSPDDDVTTTVAVAEEETEQVGNDVTAFDDDVTETAKEQVDEPTHGNKQLSQDADDAPAAAAAGDNDDDKRAGYDLPATARLISLLTSSTIFHRAVCSVVLHPQRSKVPCSQA